MSPGDSLVRRPIRVMVVDDSAPANKLVADTLQAEPDVVVVSRPADGEQALAEVFRLQPDAICLDLEMPRMDGFTFLRLLMSRRPTPVLVVTSRGDKADVFRALELGALDFVVRPPEPAGLSDFREELLQRIRMVQGLRLDSLERRAAEARGEEGGTAPARLAVIGASTGGPPALQRLLSGMRSDVPLAILVAQHMPERFTRTFAERMGRVSSYRVSEAEEGDAVTAGRVLVAPGGHHLTVERVGNGLRARVLDHREVAGRRYCPSIDLLFESAARAMADRVCGVILTGMGNDGRRGTEAIKAVGGLTLAESEESAVMYGMPEEAIATGRVDEVIALERMAERIVRFARGG
ncbi:MAG TPA: chemotaxis-specific protein-glutamate methyltransferase CheB [Anaeromyxobacteraceae bacterium]|nr:chemotaxis-specific protein-glutamate methyltransferase CheB [Anaeromyxobacteraceae bacterium]